MSGTKRKRRPPPTPAEIARAQCCIVPHLPHIDPAEAEARCWACGAEGTTTRAHIQAHSMGGDSDPTNFLLLCNVCHAEQPDGADLRTQLLWLTGHESQMSRLVRKAQELVGALTAAASACGKYHLLQEWAESVRDVAPAATAGSKNGKSSVPLVQAHVSAFLAWAEDRT